MNPHMAVVQIITFNTQPGTGGEFATGFSPIVEKVKKEPGCERYELFRSVADQDTFVMG